MKSLNQYITEFININNIIVYKYHPKTKEELIENIKIELDNGNTNLNCIDTSKITDMSNLFYKDYGVKLTKEQQETLDLSNWDVSNVGNMMFMFFTCEHFNSDLSKWKVSNVENMLSMFNQCKQFNCDLSNWNVSNAIDMRYMFYNCENFNCDLSKWKVSNAKDMGNMFYGSGLHGKEPSWYKK